MRVNCIFIILVWFFNNIIELYISNNILDNTDIGPGKKYIIY